MNWTHSALLHMAIPFETNLAQIKNDHAINMNYLPFSLYRGMFLLSFKKGKETWICDLCKTTFSKGASKVVRRCANTTWNTIHCSVLIEKTQSF